LQGISQSENNIKFATESNYGYSCDSDDCDYDYDDYNYNHDCCNDNDDNDDDGNINKCNMVHSSHNNNDNIHTDNSNACQTAPKKYFSMLETAKHLVADLATKVHKHKGENKHCKKHNYHKKQDLCWLMGLEDEDDNDDKTTTKRNSRTLHKPPKPCQDL